MVLSTLLQNSVVLFPISEPRGPLPFPSEPHGPSYLLQILMALSLSPQNRVVFSLFLLQNHIALFLSPQNLVVPSTYGCRASV